MAEVGSVTIDAFRGRVGENFQIVVEDQRFGCTLSECSSLVRGDEKPEGREPFSLIFLGPREPVLPQRIYRVESESDALEMFLVPVGASEAGTQYQAIFS